MCRWIAYCGSPILLDTLLFKPEHSLVHQSRHTLHASRLQKRPPRMALASNEDGTGVGWYGERERPGVYREILPAWHDTNLRSLARQVRSRLFLGHVRASSGTAVQRTNCHPFHRGRWLFQHNGGVAEFMKIKRAIDLEIAPELYPHLEGSTDSERMFFLALTYGLIDDPHGGLSRMAGKIESLGRQAGIQDPLTMTVAVSDGKRIFAVRYSSSGDSPSLFHGGSLHALREVGGQYEQVPDDAVVILSEPLDRVSEHWEEVPEATLLTVENGRVTSSRFEPA